ncbi:MAG: aminotransferase class I/II-fold pyridoxal phosphate-dependent enzyme [Candidatus Dormibacterales bacterium]
MDLGSPVAGHTARALASAAGIFRFFMEARDLDHPEACDFLAGNPQEKAMPAYVDAVQRALVPDSASYYAYGPAWPPAVKAAAEALGGRLGLDLDVNDVFLTRGAGSGLVVLLHTLVDAGDQVMMMSPPWFFYESLVLAESAEPVKVPLKEDTFDLDLRAIENAITARTRAVIVNTPHNPSGRIYPEDQLRGLAEILKRASARNGRRIYLLSDEAYARILFDGREMITPARFYPATFMLHTYSKTLLAPSQRAGYMAMPPTMPAREELRMALMAGSMIAGAIPDTAMQRALPELEKLIIDMPAIQRRRDRMVSELRRYGYSVESPEATFYLFPRCPIPDATEFCEWLAERRVYTLPGEAFERPGYFRLSLSATDAMVDRALPVLAEAIQTLRS